MFSIIRTIFILLLATISLNALLAMDETAKSQEFLPAETTLVVAHGSNAELLAAMQTWWLACDSERAFAQIITAEPGPAQLDSGLRVLGNAIYPKFEMPRWLVISLDGDMPSDFVFHALMRRALQADVKVWVVTEALPENLDRPDLRKAEGFRVVTPDYAVLAFQALAERCKMPPQRQESND